MPGRSALGSHREGISSVQLTLEEREGEPGEKDLQEEKLHKEKEERSRREREGQKQSEDKKRQS